MTRFRFIAEEASEFPVSLLCRCVGVTRQGYYAWRRRPPSPRSVEDARLGGLIRQIYDGAFAVYGAPRIHAELRLEHGEQISRKRVARIMRELGLRGVDGRRGGPQTLR